MSVCENVLTELAKYKDNTTATGEMRAPGAEISVSTETVESVPLSSSVNYDLLVEGDESPMEVVVEIPAGKSKRGWNYTQDSIKSIVGQVMDKTAAGFKGHQKPEDVSTQFLNPATHWIGAKYDEARKSGFFRGYVDPSEPELRRLIKTGRIKEVSIFGKMSLAKVAGETQVTDCSLLSIDWTPLGRPGMPTGVVDITIKGEMEDNTVTKEELLAELKKQQAAGDITAEELQEIVPEKEKELTDEEKLALQSEYITNLVKDSGVSVEEGKDVSTFIKELVEAHVAQGKPDTDRLAKEVIEEKFNDNKEAQELASEMFMYTGETKEEIAGEMDTFLNKPAIKKVFNSLMIDSSNPGGRDNRNKNTDTSYARVVSRSI